jgi:hypothetical protein
VLKNATKRALMKKAENLIDKDFQLCSEMEI